MYCVIALLVAKSLAGMDSARPSANCKSGQESTNNEYMTPRSYAILNYVQE